MNKQEKPNDWANVSVRRSLHDAVRAFVVMREDATITNITQFVDLAIRDKLSAHVKLAKTRGGEKKV